MGTGQRKGKKHYNCDVLQNKYLLSTEETAFDVRLLKNFASLLVVGAIPFTTYADAYNRQFSFINKEAHDKGNQRIMVFIR
jgi:hypothetical protein